MQNNVEFLVELQVWAEDGTGDWHCAQTLGESNKYYLSLLL